MQLQPAGIGYKSKQGVLCNTGARGLPAAVQLHKALVIELACALFNTE